MSGERACDLVDSKSYWHLIRSVINDSVPSNTRYSVYPRAVDEPPFDEAKMAADSHRETTRFRTESKLPSYMALCHAAALQFIGAAITHENTANKVPGKAAEFLSLAFKKLYRTPLEPKLVASIASQLATSKTSSELATIGTDFRAHFDSSMWPAKATAHAKEWQQVFHATPAEAEAWSAFFYVTSACGATVSNPNFVNEILYKISGVGSKEIDKLAAHINESSLKLEDSDLETAVRCTLLQANTAHETPKL